MSDRSFSLVRVVSTVLVVVLFALIAVGIQSMSDSAAVLVQRSAP